MGRGGAPGRGSPWTACTMAWAATSEEQRARKWERIPHDTDILAAEPRKLVVFFFFFGGGRFVFFFFSLPYVWSVCGLLVLWSCKGSVGFVFAGVCLWFVGFVFLQGFCSVFFCRLQPKELFQLFRVVVSFGSDHFFAGAAKSTACWYHTKRSKEATHEFRGRLRVGSGLL